MTLTSLSIVLTVFILQLYHAGPSHRQRMPSWLRQFFVFRIGPALGVRHPAIRQSPTTIAQTVLLSALPCRRPLAANSVNLELGTVPQVSGYLPLGVRSVRPNSMESASSQQRKRDTVRDDPITRHLKLCLERHRAEQEFEDIITEWRLLALIFDRLMFWIFLVGTAMSTVFILVILPLTKPDT